MPTYLDGKWYFGGVEPSWLELKALPAGTIEGTVERPVRGTYKGQGIHFDLLHPPGFGASSSADTGIAFDLTATES